MASHQCPVNGCPRRVAMHMLMDRDHWYMVPRPLRNAVWDAYDGGFGAGTPEHMDAIRAAVEAVNAKIKPHEADGGQK
jgi:hypothetical protein